jgi:hypothetical protein
MPALTSELGPTTDRLSTSSQLVASAGLVTVAMGERLHLYDTIEALGGVTTVELAAARCLPLWFTQGWLAAQAAGGYLTIDEQTNKYRLECRLPRPDARQEEG